MPETPASCLLLPTQQQSQCAPPSPPITADHRKTPSILPSFYYEPNGVPVFKPTLEEFEDFAVFMQAIDGHGKAAGIVKVIPPPEWSARLPDITPALSTVKIRKPITQEISGTGADANLVVLSAGCKTVRNAVESTDAGELPPTDGQAAPRKVPRKRAAPPKPTPVSFDPSVTSSGFTDEYCAELERFYWRNIAYAAPMYGADMLGSLFDADDVRTVLETSQKTNSWNLAHLDNLLKRVKAKLPGVTMPYLYFGMWKATFAWHVEDMDLYSINYIHFGAPKQWYVVPPDVRDKFERVASETFLHEAEKCSEFLRHKTSILSPKYLASRGVNVNRVVQRAGEFMITFPYGYHQGFNFGFNCAESVNFALESWVEIGKQAGHCKCVGDSVKLDVAGIFDPPTCMLCVDPHGPLLPTDKEKAFAHRQCAIFVPATEIVTGIDLIERARWRLKCAICKPKSAQKAAGACIQCARGKCVRAYHVSCAVKAEGVKMVADADVPHCFW
ncbi:JmjC domain, hydroxylase-domain-containing protein [Geranomyces variabilis]|nr:JmjC domain, hydroxylase-domain-containing protein [Geranomyces variabilis]